MFGLPSGPSGAFFSTGKGCTATVGVSRKSYLLEEQVPGDAHLAAHRQGVDHVLQQCSARARLGAGQQVGIELAVPCLGIDLEQARAVD